MTNSKNTKRTLIASAVSVMICVAMLIGTTFAWFTDTAGTAVNKIQSGNLDIALVDENGKSLENGYLKWKVIDDKTQENILWEPGCTYELQPVYVKNNGNLAVKFKVEVTGVKGDAKLLDVIDFTYGGLDINGEGHLAAGKTSDEVIKISAHMKETAGNDYMNETLDGVAITVYATQDTVEHDSFDNKYDEKAKYAAVVDDGRFIYSGTETVDKGIIIKNHPSAVALVIGDVRAESRSAADVTITDGYFDGGNAGDNVCIEVVSGSKLTIKDGYFTVGEDAVGGSNSCIYVIEGSVVIEGGFFAPHDGKPYTALNCQNTNYKNGKASISVKGGTFVNFDPSNNPEGKGTTFVADGYKVVSEKQANGDTWYTVVAK